MEFHTRLRRFISRKKSSLFLILPCAIAFFFQSPTNRDVPRTEKRVTHNQIGNVPTNDWPIIIQLQDCNGPRKGKDHWKDHAPVASQPFSPSLSNRVFSLFIPSIQMSSINSYPNGTPVNNQGQALEAQRLHKLSRSGQDNSRGYIGFARSNCRDAQGIFWRARYSLLKDIKVTGVFDPEL